MSGYCTNILPTVLILVWLVSPIVMIAIVALILTRRRAQLWITRYLPLLVVFGYSSLIIMLASWIIFNGWLALLLYLVFCPLIGLVFLRRGSGNGDGGDGGGEPRHPIGPDWDQFDSVRQRWERTPVTH